MTDIVASATKAVNGAVNTVKDTASNAFQMVANITNSKGANSLLPLGNTKNNVVNAPVNSAANSGAAGMVMLYVGLAVLFLALFAYFNKQIREALDYITRSLRRFFGISTPPDQLPPPPDQPTATPQPPQGPQPPLTPQQAIVEKVLPVGSKEVYNISQNTFSFYDAEPLCKALGAELATYDQVKDSWNKGADWCNYGWVKGQMAVYPTQQDTYDKLQGGSPDQANACGTVGVNGGVFDNPELRFGVNCYGPKPEQSVHDEKMLMENGKVPKSPGELKFNQKIDEFKKAIPGLFIQPFNNDKWSA